MSFRLIIAAFAVSAATIFAGPAMAEEETVSGTVTYLNRSALPPGSVLNVELVDVSRADAPSINMSSRRYSIDRVPFPFELSYDALLIDERYSYAIQAQISQDGKVLYRTTTRFPALTRNAPEQVDVIVDQMSDPSSPGLEGSSWEVNEITGRLLVSDKRPSIRFLADGMVSIDSSCNKFSGPVEISGSSISFSDKMAGTLRACTSPYDAIETAILAVLPQVTGWKYEAGDQLSLTNSAGVTVLRLNRPN